VSGARIESHVHSTSGFLPWIEIGDFRLQSYFVVVSLVLSLCAFFIFKRSERPIFQKNGLSTSSALDLFIGAMIGGFLGARLLHIVWEEPRYYAEDLWRVFDVASGGFVWMGGAAGGVATILAMLRWKKADKSLILKWLDFFSPVAAFGYAGGRMACVLTGCCFGAVCDWPLAFRFPTQGFAVLWELSVGLWLLRQEKSRRQPGVVFFTWISLHGVGRIAMELLRADPRGPAFGPLTISMAMSFVLLFFGAFQLRRTLRPEAHQP